MIDPGTKRVSYLRRLVTFALTLGIVIATFDVLSKGEHFFVPLVMAVLAVYLVDILSRLIRKIPIAGHSVPNAISVILAFGIIFRTWFCLNRDRCAKRASRRCSRAEVSGPVTAITGRSLFQGRN